MVNTHRLWPTGCCEPVTCIRRRLAAEAHQARKGGAEDIHIQQTHPQRGILSQCYRQVCCDQSE